MTRLSTIWDGEVHLLEHGVDFHRIAFIILEGFEEEELDEETTNWESESLVPVTRKDSFSHVTIEGFEMEHGWGVFAMAMNSLCKVIGVERNMFQHNRWPETGGGQPERRFSFQLKMGEEGSGYQGGPL